jgi:hypothetical protein
MRRVTITVQVQLNRREGSSPPPTESTTSLRPLEIAPEGTAQRVGAFWTRRVPQTGIVTNGRSNAEEFALGCQRFGVTATAQEAKSEVFYNAPTSSVRLDDFSLAYYYGHGSETSLVMADGAGVRDEVAQSECQWGARSLRWVVLDACATLRWLPLAVMRGVPENTPNPFRWREVFRGLRGVLGWSTLARDIPGRGHELARGLSEGLPLRTAWRHVVEEFADDLTQMCYASLVVDDGTESGASTDVIAGPVPRALEAANLVWSGLQPMEGA